MESQLIQGRLIASMLGGALCGALGLAGLWILWPGPFGPVPPVVVGLTGVLGAAGGAFGALIKLSPSNSLRQSKGDQGAKT